MRFFVPYAEGPADAERFWRAMHAPRGPIRPPHHQPAHPRARDRSRSDRGRRRHAEARLSGCRAGNLESADIDRLLPERSRRIFTHIHGELDPPFPMRLDHEWRVADFD